MSKLTKQAVKDLEKPEKGQTFLWDGELRGFGVRTIPSGLKTFVLQYRNAEGRSRRIVLGRFGVMTVEQARDEARIKLGAVAHGNDPAEEAGPQEMITVAEVCGSGVWPRQGGPAPASLDVETGRSSHPPWQWIEAESRPISSR